MSGDNDTMSVKEFRATVIKARKQQQRLQTLEAAVSTLSGELTDTLSELKPTVQLTRKPIMVRIGSNVFHVAMSETHNPVEPVVIRTAEYM